MRRITLAALAALVTFAAATPALAGGYAYDQMTGRCTPWNPCRQSGGNGGGINWNNILNNAFRDGQRQFQRSYQQNERYRYQRQDQIDELEVQDIQQRRYFQAIQNCRALGYTGAKPRRDIFECTP